MQLLEAKKGFTLTETLVAIAIISIGLIAPITVAFVSIQATDRTVDRAIAYYLAQEGAEYVRYVRDTNNLERDPWLQGLGRCTSGSSVCDISNVLSDVTNDSDMLNCPGTACSNPVEFNGSYYNGTGGSDTKFIRSIDINLIGSNEAEVVVTVDWVGRTENHSITVREHIFNWTGL